MTTVVHLSDLHFGRADETIVHGLRDAVTALAPAAVVVSGDLTQRARPEQFAAATQFLASLPFPQVVVPGNHDVPLYNVIERVGRPLARYRRQVTTDLRPQLLAPGVAIYGLNTTRSWTIKGGHARAGDVERLRDALQRLDTAVVKMVVAHHPFGPSVPEPEIHPDRRAEAALAALTDAGADVFLTGHLHVSYAGHRAARYHAGGRTAIVLWAGTATSTRVRGEPNSFNVLRVDATRIGIERFTWSDSGRRFEPEPPTEFARTATGWVRQDRGGPPGAQSHSALL